MYESINTYISSLHTTLALKYISFEYNNSLEEKLKPIDILPDDILNKLQNDSFVIIKDIVNENLFIIKFIYNNMIGSIYSNIFQKYLNREYNICKQINQNDIYFGPFFEKIYKIKNINFNRNNDILKITKGNLECIFTLEPLFSVFLNESNYKNLNSIQSKKFDCFSIFNNVHIDSSKYCVRSDSIDNWIETILQNIDKKEIFFYENFIDQIIEESFSRYNNKRTIKIKNLDDFKTLYSHIVSRIELFYKDCSGISIESIEINASELNSFYNTILQPFFSSSSFGIKDDEFSLDNMSHKESIIRKYFGGETNYALYIMYKKLTNYVNLSNNIKIKHYENEINKMLNLFLSKLIEFNDQYGFTGYFSKDDIKVISFYNFKTNDIPEFNYLILSNNNNIYCNEFYGFMPIKNISNSIYDTSLINKMIFPDRPYLFKDIYNVLKIFQKVSKLISHIDILIQKFECIIYTEGLFDKWNVDYSVSSMKFKPIIQELFDSITYVDNTEYMNYILDIQSEKVIMNNKSNINFNYNEDSENSNEIDSNLTNISDLDNPYDLELEKRENELNQKKERERKEKLELERKEKEKLEQDRIRNEKIEQEKKEREKLELQKNQIDLELENEDKKKISIKKKPVVRKKPVEKVINTDEDNKIQETPILKKIEKKETQSLPVVAPVRRRASALQNASS